MVAIISSVFLAAQPQPSFAQSSTPPGQAKSDDRYIASIEVKDANVVDVLVQLFLKRGVNYTIRAGVQGRVTATFNDFDWELVIRYLAAMVNAQITKDVNGVYIVEPARPATKSGKSESEKPRSPAGPSGATMPANMTPSAPEEPFDSAQGRPEEDRRPQRRSSGGRPSIIHVRNAPATLGASFGTSIMTSTYYPFPLQWRTPVGLGASFGGFGVIDLPAGYALQFYQLFTPHLPRHP